MVYPSSKGNLLIGPEYLRNLGFTYLEMNGLYDKNNYFAINPLNSTMDDDYSAIKEHSLFIFNIIHKDWILMLLFLALLVKYFFYCGFWGYIKFF